MVKGDTKRKISKYLEMTEKVKHNLPKFLRCSQSSAQRKIYSSKVPILEKKMGLKSMFSASTEPLPCHSRCVPHMLHLLISID